MIYKFPIINNLHSNSDLNLFDENESKNKKRDRKTRFR